MCGDEETNQKSHFAEVANTRRYSHSAYAHGDGASPVGLVARLERLALSHLGGIMSSTFTHRLMVHKWWVGITGIVTVAALVVALMQYLGSRSADLSPSVQSKAGNNSANCNASGSGNNLTCVVSAPAPDASLKDLEITTEPSDDLGVSYVIPLTRGWKDLPLKDDAGLCSTAQVSWLKAHGYEVWDSFITSIRSSANSGPMISLTNLRVEELTVKQSEPNIFFQCPTAGSGSTVVATLDLDQRGKVQVQQSDSTDALKLPGSAFSFNLQPGESGTIIFHPRGLDGYYTGRVVATVRAGSESRDVTIPLNGETFTRNGPGKSQDLRISPRENLDSPKPFVCRGGLIDGECDLADIESALKKIWPDAA